MNSRLSIVGQSGHEDHDHGSCDAPIQLNIQGGETGITAREFRGRAAIVTLGCAKNRVDSEVMLGVLRNSGFEIVDDLTLADVAIVNTCGFLESAVKESIDAILEVAELKKTARLRTLIVAGCVVSRYGKEFQTTLPEVDRFITTEDLLKVGEAATGGVSDLLDAAARPYFLYDDTMPRCISTNRHMAYVKIAEGCNRPCTYCIIPKIRGAMRSRPIESVVSEALQLRAQGVREINLIAQDLTAYGSDTKGGDLTKLLRSLDSAQAMEWIRLLYAYPIGIDESLLRAIVDLPSVCNYLDLPLQHSSEAVLKAMKRPVGRYGARSIVEFIRRTAPEIHLRTTFIVGFPGESEADIAELEAFISEGHFSSVGIFTYSAERGTPAAELAGQISEREKKARRKRLMLAQQRVNAERLAGFVGSRLAVLVEGAHEETDLLLVGRSRFQAPEVDGTVIINDIDPQSGGLTPEGEPSPADALTGAIGEVEITEVAGYDLLGTLRSLDRVTSTRQIAN